MTADWHRIRTGARGEAASRLLELREDLARALLSLRSAQRWQQYLSFAAGFRDFSFHNGVLLFAANPHARLVAGYEMRADWGYQVSKGETGIALLAGERGDVTPRRPGGVTGLRIATVFDVAQVTLRREDGRTDDGGQVLPAPVGATSRRAVTLTENDLGSLRERLEAHIVDLGFTLFLPAFKRGLASDLDGGRVVVELGGDT